MNYEKIVTRTFSMYGIAGFYSLLESKLNTISQKIILEYHGINRNISFNCVSFDNFKKQMEYVTKNYRVVSLEDLYGTIVSPSGKNENLISVSFDDAYANVYFFAYPLLKKMEISFTVFVPAGFVGKTNIYDKSAEGFEEIEIMAYAHMRDMAPDIASFGSHGLTHRSLRKMEFKELHREVHDSKCILEQGIARKVKFFCYPYGGKNDFDKRTITVVKENGFICACSTIWGRFNSVKTIYALRRIEIEPTDSMDDFILKLKGGHDWKRIRHEVRILISKAVSC